MIQFAKSSKKLVGFFITKTKNKTKKQKKNKYEGSHFAIFKLVMFQGLIDIIASLNSEKKENGLFSVHNNLWLEVLFFKNCL